LGLGPKVGAGAGAWAALPPAAQLRALVIDWLVLRSALPIAAPKPTLTCVLSPSMVLLKESSSCPTVLRPGTISMMAATPSEIPFDYLVVGLLAIDSLIVRGASPMVMSVSENTP
jgi:hypothetical protein